MRRSSLIVLAALAAITACSDTSAPPTPALQPPTRVSPTTTQGDLDIEIGKTIIALFPKGLETSAGTRWGNVKRTLDGGDRTTAVKMLNELSDWILKKQGQMDGTPPNETEQHATARLLAMMAAYVYGVESPIPLDARSGDVAVDIVMPDAAKTIVTPSKHAGIALDAGSVAEPTLIVITDVPDGSSSYCAGPLQTALCQFPLFYRFEPFPYRRLQKPAKFGVCHVHDGPFAAPPHLHDRFRLAHTLPADEANYTPGAIRPLGENVEILPLVQVDFMDCTGATYGYLTPKESPLQERHWYDRGLLALGSAVDAARSFLTPKDAYAIDLGGGGEGMAFSSFGVLDPVRLNDSGVIDFEQFPSLVSTSSCDPFCRIANEFETFGVRFGFVPDITGKEIGVTVESDHGNNPSGDQNNHVVASAHLFDDGGYFSGTIVMRPVGAPESVSFVVRANECAQPTVTARGVMETDNPSIVRSEGFLYGGGEGECQRFREETITVTN